jgi:hypothetical protein
MQVTQLLYRNQTKFIPIIFLPDFLGGLEVYIVHNIPHHLLKQKINHLIKVKRKKIFYRPELASNLTSCFKIYFVPFSAGMHGQKIISEIQ